MQTSEEVKKKIEPLIEIVDQLCERRDSGVQGECFSPSNPRDGMSDITHTEHIIVHGAT